MTGRASQALALPGPHDPRWRQPDDAPWLLRRQQGWARRLGTAPPMRITASWSGPNTAQPNTRVWRDVLRRRREVPLGSNRITQARNKEQNPRPTTAQQPERQSRGHRPAWSKTRTCAGTGGAVAARVARVPGERRHPGVRPVGSIVLGTRNRSVPQDLEPLSGKSPPRHEPPSAPVLWARTAPSALP